MPDPTVPKSTPFTVRCFTDGVDTAKVRLTLNDTVNMELPYVAPATFVDFRFNAGLPVGTHVFKAEGVNAVGVAGPSATHTIVVVPGVPSAITKIEILVAS